MTRYFRAPRALRFDDGGYPDDAPVIANLEVDEPVATDTGLLDADGYAIFRAPNPIGFGRDEDW